MSQEEILEKIFELAGISTHESWKEAAQLMLDNDTDTIELVEYINRVEPPETADWVVRAEMFESALYLRNAKEAREKGHL